MVLNNVSIDINAPGITVIIGENGAGKSTLLSALAGLLPLDRGPQRLSETDGRQAPITRVGYVLQKPVLLRRSIAGNIDFAMAAVDIPLAQRPSLRAQVLEVMNIHQNPKQSAFRLSQGEKQRLAVARVLAMRPGMLMLDESTNSLDQQTVTLMENHIRNLADQGLPVIWVTHSLDQAKRLADRVVQIKNGTIETDCAAADFFR
ncbi:MAG: ABC transporter ATP-binding protein [Alphaproteobacteria bacterium]